MGGPRLTVLALVLQLVSSAVDALVSVNEDGDTLQMKLAKYANHMEKGLRLTEGVYRVPVSIDDLFNQIASIPSDDQGQNVDSECLNGSELSEMDMCLTPSQVGMFTSVRGFGQVGTRTRRQASANGFSLWKNGVIPYMFNSTFPSQDRDAILGAMSEWERTTCISFRPANRDDADVVVFRDGRRCSTNIGHIGGEQIVTLAKNCRSKRILIHELGHVIGLIHEHQRHDRDKYVRVLLENVRNMSQERYQFSKLLSGSITEKAVKYDYTSVMHYGRNYFAKSPELTTLQTTERLFQDVIGRAEKPSFGDTETVNRLYKCSAECPPSLQCQESCYLDSLCICRCPTTIDKFYQNGTGSYQNSLMDSTCEFFASRGECTGNLKDTVRPLCAKTCNLHQAGLSSPAVETWTQAPPSNTNHVQMKPGGSQWGTRPNNQRFLAVGRNNFQNSDINSISDVNFLRNTEAQQVALLVPAGHILQQHGVSSHQSYIQNGQFMPLANLQNLESRYLQQDIMNSPLTDNLRAALQQSHGTHTSGDSSMLRSLVLGQPYSDKVSRLMDRVRNNAGFVQMGQQSRGPNLNPERIQETTKAPSTILKDLWNGEAATRHDPNSGLPVWLRLSNISRQTPQQHQNRQGSFHMVQTTAMPLLSGHILGDLLDATRAKLSGSQSPGGSNNWQAGPGIWNRNSESLTSQATEMRNVALPDPYNPIGQHSARPNGVFSLNEQRPKILGSGQMGSLNVDVDRAIGSVTSVDFTGPEVGQSGATVPGVGGVQNNKSPGLDSGRNLQTTGPSFMKQGVVPQSLVVSEQNPPLGNPVEQVFKEQNPPLGNPVEQVFNEPWKLHVQEAAPATEVQPVGQAFQYYEPHQSQNNFDPVISQIGQFAWENQGGSVANNERLMDNTGFPQYQQPIDHHALESPQSPVTVRQPQETVNTDSNNGNFPRQHNQQQQQLSSLFEMINMHQSFTDPFADTMSSISENIPSITQHHFSASISDIPPSQNFNSTGHNPYLNTLFQNLKHIPPAGTLKTNCCSETNTNVTTEYLNGALQSDHLLNGKLKGLLQLFHSRLLDVRTLISEITSRRRYPNRASEHTNRASEHPNRASEHPNRSSEHPNRASDHHNRASEQSQLLYLLISKLKLLKQNSSVHNLTESVLTNGSSVKAAVSGSDKQKVYQMATKTSEIPYHHQQPAANIRQLAGPQLAVDSGYWVPFQTQEPVYQIHSGIHGYNHSPWDTFFPQQMHVK